ncbi:hypothetical protein KSP40_PGU009781 [Platanthera guangdongensis]|uniref:Uncharacterized protein n=1 Tax=Platanthera guangdongensis TaxID=2320717 RepID=A0ABR2LM15_9ASPA
MAFGSIVVVGNNGCVVLEKVVTTIGDMGSGRTIFRDVDLGCVGLLDARTAWSAQHFTRPFCIAIITYLIMQQRSLPFWGLLSLLNSFIPHTPVRLRPVSSSDSRRAEFLQQALTTLVEQNSSRMTFLLSQAVPVRAFSHHQGAYLTELQSLPSSFSCDAHAQDHITQIPNVDGWVQKHRLFIEWKHNEAKWIYGRERLSWKATQDAGKLSCTTLEWRCGNCSVGKRVDRRSRWGRGRHREQWRRHMQRQSGQISREDCVVDASHWEEDFERRKLRQEERHVRTNCLLSKK